MKKLHIGCGRDIKNGFVNLDSVKLPGVDVVHDLNKYPWPFKKDYFDYVYASHVLEHLNSTIDPMEEIWRITKHGAKVSVEVPIFPSIGSVADPTHRVFYTYRTFDYFRPEDGLNYYSKARFMILSKQIIFHKPLLLFQWFFNSSIKMQKFYTQYLSFMIPAFALRVELKTLK
jgi:SAM-dependent methyltransferase